MSARILSPYARLTKLRAMSVPEVMHRLRYAAQLTAERRQHKAGRLAPPDRLRRALAARFSAGSWEDQLLRSRREHRTLYFKSMVDGDAMRSLFASRYAAEREDARAHAARARRQEFEFFGSTFTYPADIDWQSDPVSGRRWPSLYHADMPVHGGDTGYGDVKYVWELSRQQFLIDLGKAWYLDRDPENLQAVERLVRSWIEGNPYATGVNWSCALEPAFRVFSWLWAYYFTVEELDRAFHLEWLRAFHDHGRFIEAHLELYSSPYNHLIAEAAALYMIGTCFPEFRDAERWRATGRSVLQQRLAEQFYADGGSVEQSTFYHHATVGFYLLAGIVARAAGDDLGTEIWSAIERGLDYSLTLTQPDGSTPRIGGADDGKPIRMEHLPFWDFRPYLAMGAVLFDRADFKHAAGRFHEDALWLLGPAALERFEAMRPMSPAATAAALPSSGYYVMRTDWSPGADYVCFDCGEQAAGMRTDAVPNSMHGHADCLSVILWLEGRPVLVDSGLFAYNCGGSWEAHFRETAAHNTATVDGRDQARHIKSMAWTHSYRATTEEWNAQGDRAWVLGSHDGYSRGPDGVIHRRAVWLRPDSCVLIYDEFVGSGKHDLTVNYQFAPGGLEPSAPDRVTFDGRVDIAWAGSHHWTATRVCGGEGPEEGWIAPSLGIRRPAPRLVLQCTSSAPRTSLLTVIAARIGDGPRVDILEEREADGALALVSAADHVDCVAAAGVSRSHPIDTDALLAVCRIRGDGTIETNRIGGARLNVDTDALRWLAAPVTEKRVLRR
jgi:hypothetical protein